MRLLILSILQSDEASAEDIEKELFGDVTEQFLVHKDHGQSNGKAKPFLKNQGELSLQEHHVFIQNVLGRSNPH